MSTFEMEALDFKYLLLEYYRKLNLNENDLSVILMIDHLLEQKNTLITPDLLSLKMSLSSKELDKIFVALIEKNLLVFDTSKNIKVSLKPLKNKLYELFQISLAKEQNKKLEDDKNNSLQNIFEVFEKELSRPLSPLEISLISGWIDDGFSDETIINALKEVLSKGKKTLKDVDRVLLQWQARDDIEKTGYTSISKDWRKDMKKTMEIAKAKWIDD